MTDYARRQWLGRAAVGGVGAALTVAAVPPPAMAAAATSAGVNVRDYGALGDGTSDDTAAVQRAIAAAGGDLVYFPAGTYPLNKVAVTTAADLMLGIGATLRHLPAGADDYMIGFASTFLRIRGGVLDGNKSNQTGRTSLVAGAVPSGRRLVLEGVTVVNSVKAAVYAYTFGGTISIDSCTFEGQAEHDGTPGHYTAILAVVSGQAGAKGSVSFNHNHAVGTAAPRITGGFPGGVFMAPSTGSTTGTGATLEAVGNHFRGYGQNCAGNTISPIHTYPAVSGARVIGNYFEACGSAAVSAKSLGNFVCADNVIVDGTVNEAGAPAEGAITYAPSYLAGSTSYPRAVISGNVITKPGGTAARPANGICVFGSATSTASQVIVSNNVLEGCGTAVTAAYATDLTIAQNIITGRDTGPVATSGAIRLDNCFGRISISENKILNRLNHALSLYTGLGKAQIRLHGNEIQQEAAGYYGAFLGGLDQASVVANTFSGGGSSLTARGSGTQHLKRFHMDASNTFAPGRSPNFVWADIDAVFGDVAYVNSPVGAVAPGEVGVRYTQRNGTPGKTLWLSTGTTRTSWVALS
ncbi:glycosyl hydrolase family 28-related protein [Intrasporangium sp. YIM S08009]|uniref:glycosyl hydrolase family 28-related protein n=1 Tax=Intrasporangium zincisolvens TaxID=3080018 RepID=UPI002B05BB48|nr:glycosyl hydrolase family 28-related protein [Intrasporangium sp. YIM S08009]